MLHDYLSTFTEDFWKKLFCTALLKMKQHTLIGNNWPMPKKWITETLKPGKIRREKKNRGNSLILQYRVVYMHISWFSHTDHTTVRPWRPKPLLKGLSSKAGDKITHRLRVLSHAGLLTVTRLCCVPQAVSTTLKLCDSSALQFPCSKLSPLSYICSYTSMCVWGAFRCSTEDYERKDICYSTFFKCGEGNNIPKVHHNSL